MRLRVHGLASLLLLLHAWSAALAAGAAATTIWTTGDRLMPAWGFFRNGATYGGTKPLGEGSAWTCGGGTHKLTWVADFPAVGEYQVWVRKYGGYGSVEVTVDDRPVAGGRGGPGGGRYVWRHAGAIQVTRGRHHVDLIVSNGMLDAVLMSLDESFHPADDDLPPPVENPDLRDARTYRDDSHLAKSAGPKQFVCARVTPYAEIRYDWLPGEDCLTESVHLWGSPTQYAVGTFAVRALEALAEFRVELDAICGPGGARIESGDVDLRVVHQRSRGMTMPATRRYVDEFPDLLLRDARTELPPKGNQGGFGGSRCVVDLPAHESRQFWVTVPIPEKTAPGVYRGRLRITAAGLAAPVHLPVELEVLDLELKPVEGYYSIYYPSQPVKPERPNFVRRERYLAELRDQVRHGLNSTTLYGGFDSLAYAAEAGMTRAPCLMHWPPGNANKQIAEAKELGFDGLLYYGVDEPRSAEQIQRCLKEARRRLDRGLPMFTAINSTEAQAVLRDYVTHPVYNLKVFDTPGNDQVQYVLEKGFHPVSYWTTAPPFPLYYRVMAGLYNTACGYLGTAPWAYQDYPDARLYSEPCHAVAYPDELGNPIPTLRWEAFRDGVDDVRYLQALDRAIAAAERCLAGPDAPPGLKAALEHAKNVRRERFESIDGRWFRYLFGLQPGDLAAVRRALAEATVELTIAAGRSEPDSADRRER